MKSWRTFAVLALLMTAWGCEAGDPGGAPAGGVVADGRIAVPEGDGRPVLTDGIFTPGEWEDALHIPVDQSVTLHFKQVRDHVFIGVSITGMQVPVVDLFFQAGDGPVAQYHASGQLGERILAPSGEEDPDFQWGMTSDWYANEVRYDAPLRARLEAETGDRRAATEAAVYPYEGFEMQFRRSKLASSEPRMRLEIAGGPDYETPWVYPAGTKRKDRSGWAVLVLSDASGGPPSIDRARGQGLSGSYGSGVPGGIGGSSASDVAWSTRTCPAGYRTQKFGGAWRTGYSSFGSRSRL